MVKKQTTIYLNEAATRWITEKAERDGVSKSTVVQILINKAMNDEPANQKTR